MISSREWSFGNHRARFESPDVLFFYLNGAIRLEDARAIIDIYREVTARGPLFTVGEVSNTSSDKEARAYLGKHLEPKWFQGSALIGAGLLQQAAIKSILVTLYLTTQWDLFPEFVDSEARARAFVARKRAERPGQPAAGESMYRIAYAMLLAFTCVGCTTARPAHFRIEQGSVSRSAMLQPTSLWLPEFEIDRTLVSQGAYTQCVLEGACEAPPPGAQMSRQELPMTHVSWSQAERYCASQGKRLPTSAEFERMREVNPKALETGRHEWVDDWYTYYGRDFLPLRTPHGLVANTRLVRGERYYGMAPSESHPEVGFRCSRWLPAMAATR